MEKIIVEVALPIYNEEQELEKNTLILHNYLKQIYHNDFIITIADNASTDSSPQIANKLVLKYPNIRYFVLPEKGRGRAIKKVWLNSNAKVMAYMDIDLSTKLESFPKIVNAILKDGYDLAVGSRLLLRSKIYKRPIYREILSRGLNIIIKIMFYTKFSDAQCGFKALSGKRKKMLSLIKDDKWFFDSELLIVAEKSNLKIYEEPVVWVDNPGSTVRVIGTVTGDFLGLLRLFFTRPWNKVKI